MALDWFTLLRRVPWSEVIRHTPELAEKAMKLRDAATRRPSSSAGAAATPPPAADAASANAALAEFASQMARIDGSVTEFNERMRASTELIEALTAENARLAGRVDVLAGRSVWLAWIACGAGACAVTALVIALIG